MQQDLVAEMSKILKNRSREQTDIQDQKTCRKLNHHTICSTRELRDILLMSRPPLLARRGNPSIPLLLPTAAEHSVELHQRHQFVSAGLRKSQFRIEKVTVGIKSIEERIDTAAVAHIGKA